ncbi:LytTR family transcriptional regulator DNA-binding domain-containing protein [Primorskyibacter aestuariivivens]|uniref:LytTR family DNA-binding domain-containing protein n=1 Tax=Primorskyibacter aestuariivivens TaxID=1888912 RepID=UPI0023016BED|nr:LytTR family DNA-binding domain-containing protein [Primorskyibacter aestuariivivens]MDA7427547.1 LytTR family transcriptional regulator DNA-binding domain-containing protein [Primorskyibacter aestuariivivens]
MRQIFDPVQWDRKILVFFAGVILLAVLGPFGTYESLGFAERLVYWVIVFSGVGFFMHVILTTSLKAHWLAALPPIARLGVGAVLAGLPGAAVVIFVHGVFLPPLISADTLPVIWAQVTAIGWIVGAVEFLDWGRTSDDTPQLICTRFHKRLPPELGDDIISISMQDHYAEVTTTLGTHMVLIRLADAMEELSDAEGVQLHRSHFALVSHLREIRRHGAKMRVVLSDGRELPVSTTHVDEVRSVLKKRKAH